MRTHDYQAPETKREEGSDLLQDLQERRVLFLTDELSGEKATNLCAQMIQLDLQDHERDIVLFINSPGGPLTSMLAIYDMMQAVKSNVMTICIGEASSSGALLLAAGTRGKRFCFPNARIMVHEPQGGVEGTTRDVEIEARELVYQRTQLYRIFGIHTGQSSETLHRVLERDTYMSAQEAKEFGIIDRVIEKLPEF